MLQAFLELWRSWSTGLRLASSGWADCLPGSPHALLKECLQFRSGVLYWQVDDTFVGLAVGRVEGYIEIDQKVEPESFRKGAERLCVGPHMPAYTSNLDAQFSARF